MFFLDGLQRVCSDVECLGLGVWTRTGVVRSLFFATDGAGSRRQTRYRFLFPISRGLSCQHSTEEDVSSFQIWQFLPLFIVDYVDFVFHSSRLHSHRVSFIHDEVTSKFAQKADAKYIP